MTTKTPSKKWTPTYDTAKLRLVAEMVAPRIEELLEILEVEYTITAKCIRGRCPVHDGDNPTGWAMVPDGDEIKCRWRCYTHGCHERNKFGANIFGFVRGVLSQRENREATFNDALKYLCQFIGKDYESLNVDRTELNKSLFTSHMRNLSKERSQNREGIDRKRLCSSLEIPAPYYRKRKYSAEVLEKYDVGTCRSQGKPMSNRVVVPIFNDSYDLVVGVTGRTLFPECKKCGFYHAQSYHCPQNYVEQVMGAKWRHAAHDGGEFEVRHYFYNYWFAKKMIEKEGVVILVEGPGDVWRLEENGIHCGLAMFGTYLSDEQELILERSGAMTVIAMADNDEAGQKAALRLKEKLGRLYRLYFPKFLDHDVGDMNENAITRDIKPLLEKVTKECQ